MTDPNALQTDPHNKRALVVDLDGTLTATDTLWESMLALVARSPLAVLQIPGWLLQGKAALKRSIAAQVEIDPAALPYRQEVLDLINQAKAQGRPVVLASACHQSIADAVAEHLGLFDAVVATNGRNNCRGKAKLDRILDTIQHFDGSLGDAGFDYVGDSEPDLAIWAEAHTAYLVDTPKAVARQASPQVNKIELVPNKGSSFGALIRTGRPQQWVKNLLLLVPMLLAQRAGEPGLWLDLLIAFIAMGLCASAVYLVNDLLDLQADRLHPSKRHRPLAACEVKIGWAVLAAPLVVAVSVALAWLTLPRAFVGVLLVYTASAWLYSFVVKRHIMIDVVWLACLYCIRIIAGGVAVDVELSAWLLAFALFIFLSLAFAKRYSELRLLADEGKTHVAGRAYVTDDQPLVSMMGIVSGYLAVLVLALYINSETVVELYDHPEVLWLMCPMILYWVSRLWMRAHRRLLCDDPLLFAMTDRVSYITAMVILLTAMMAA